MCVCVCARARVCAYACSDSQIMKSMSIISSAHVLAFVTMLSCFLLYRGGRKRLRRFSLPPPPPPVPPELAPSLSPSLLNSLSPSLCLPLPPSLSVSRKNAPILLFVAVVLENELGGWMRNKQTLLIIGTAGAASKREGILDSSPGVGIFPLPSRLKWSGCVCKS